MNNESNAIPLNKVDEGQEINGVGVDNDLPGNLCARLARNQMCFMWKKIEKKVLEAAVSFKCADSF